MACFFSISCAHAPRCFGNSFCKNRRKSEARWNTWVVARRGNKPFESITSSKTQPVARPAVPDTQRLKNHQRFAQPMQCSNAWSNAKLYRNLRPPIIQYKT